MAVNRTFKVDAYGLQNARQKIATQPIISNRNPTTSDTAELSTLWVNRSANTYFILTSFSQGDAIWTAQATGSGAFGSVDVTGTSGDVFTVAAGGDTDLGGDLAVAGNSVFAGDLTVNGDFVANGDFDITDSSAISLTSTFNGAQAIYLHANGGTSETVEIRADQGTGVNSVYLLSDAGGIVIEPDTSTSNTAFHVQANAGGYQLDAALTSQINVTGAGQDLQLNATGGSLALTSTESTAGAVTISASGVAGTLILQGAGGALLETTNSTLALTSGTGAINIGTDAFAHTVTVGNNTGASSVSIRGGTGASGSIGIGATANAVPVTIGNNTGATSVSIQAGTAGAGAINIATTANAVPVVIGNNTGASSVSIQAGTGGAGAINIGTSANAVPVVIGNSTGATSIAITSGTGSINLASTGSGDIILASSDTCLIDSAGVLELNSSAGAISIGNDAVAALINIGTGSSNRDITIGNNTASTTIVLNTPVGTPVSAPQGFNIGVYILSGSGSPSGTVTAPQGSLYLRTDGSTASTRAYINSDSGTTWIAVTTAS